VPIGQLELRGVYGHADAKGHTLAGVDVDANDADLYSVEGVYNLSKRTALYATAAQIKNKGLASFSILPGTVADAGLVGGKSTGYNIGIRHSF
jgi:predicted porin